jgi:SAM-dependent methyltransferase
VAIDASNQARSEFWAAAGPLWAALRNRFDNQANEHGLAAMDALDPQSGEWVLDIGCGAGTSTVQIAERVGPDGAVIGLDISPTMIEGARAHADAVGVDNASFAVGDAMVEDFAADRDAAYSRFGLMFFSDPTRAFANIGSALRPGGRFGFVCWQSPAQNGWASRPFEVAGRYVEMPFGSDPTAPGPFSLSDPERVTSLLDHAGFSDVSIEPRTSSVDVGTDMDDTVDFLFDLMPPVGALRENDPDKAAEVRAALAHELSDLDGPDGVQAPSAVWIVTAHQSN